MFENYIYISLAVASAISAIYFAIKIAQIKTRLKITEQQNSTYKEDIIVLNKEKIDHITKIAHLTTLIDKEANDQKKHDIIKQQAFNAAKENLLSTGNELVKQILIANKHSNQAAQTASEKTMDNITKTLKNDIENLMKNLNILSNDVENSNSTVTELKNALLSPISAGALAEVTLSNILNISGLKANIDFKLQHSFSSDDKTLRPDAVVFLPNNGLLIIDAKASKIVFDSEDKDSNFVKNMNFHLKSLITKEYKQNIINSYKLSEIDHNNILMVMFLPHESLVEKLQALDKNFLLRAWENNIFPVGPTGLVNMLKLATRQINETTRLENYQKILQEISILLNSVDILVNHSNKLGNTIQQLVNNYDKFAGSFNRNFISKMQQLKNLGIQANKPISLKRYQLINSNDIVSNSINQNDNIYLKEIENDPKSKTKIDLK